MIDASPADAELYSLRGLEAEQALDFAAAEADWKSHAEKSADKMAGLVALADYYHRRLESKLEFETLTKASIQNVPDSEKLLADAEQMRWKDFQPGSSNDHERAAAGCRSRACCQYNSWILQFYQGRPGLYQDFFRYTMDHERLDVAAQIIAQVCDGFSEG